MPCEDPVKKRAYNRKTRYGLTTEQYEQLLVDQDSRCAICGEASLKLQVDHCHTNGKVRGLLCPKCNTALGYLEYLKPFEPEVCLYLK